MGDRGLLQVGGGTVSNQGEEVFLVAEQGAGVVVEHGDVAGESGSVVGEVDAGAVGDVAPVAQVGWARMVSTAARCFGARWCWR